MEQRSVCRDVFVYEVEGRSWELCILAVTCKLGHIDMCELMSDVAEAARSLNCFKFQSVLLLWKLQWLPVVLSAATSNAWKNMASPLGHRVLGLPTIHPERNAVILGNPSTSGSTAGWTQGAVHWGHEAGNLHAWLQH